MSELDKLMLQRGEDKVCMVQIGKRDVHGAFGQKIFALTHVNNHAKPKQGDFYRHQMVTN